MLTGEKFWIRFCLLVILVLGAILLGQAAPLCADLCQTPTTLPVPSEQIPAFLDELDLAGLEGAVRSSVDYLRKQPDSQNYRLCGGVYNAAGLIATLETFLTLSKQAANSEELGRVVRDNFEVCRAAGRDGRGEMLVTGYYEPILEGSLVKEGSYRYPLYRLPGDLVREADPAVAGGKRVGRRAGAELLPYWSRSEIEEGGRLHGQELIYLADPVEVFILQVQGSGQVRDRDGTIYRLAYAESNGRPYRSIGRLLVEEGKIPLAEVDLPAICRYLQEHPDDRDRILNRNERYTFFSMAKISPPLPGPVGSMGEPLVGGRSLAVDRGCFPLAGLAFLQTQKPVVEGGVVQGWAPLNRFVLSQDSGAAITGPGRVDLFWGNGDYAQTAAGLLKHPGNLYFLVKKRTDPGTIFRPPAGTFEKVSPKL